MVGAMETKLLAEFVAERLSRSANVERAVQMAAYMKTNMPFYGVSAPLAHAIAAEAVAVFPPASVTEYQAAVRALWRLPHREEKYIAISYARRVRSFITSDSLDLYCDMVVEGAWWDFVDTLAAHLVGTVLLEDRDLVSPTVRSWIRSDDMWLRRTSILAQLRHKDATDTDLLAEACLANLADTEFFIRKAIGWALREYARSNPEWVIEFVTTRRDGMSGLSYREATKHLDLLSR